MKTHLKLILAIIGSLIEELFAIFLVLLVLPRLGIIVPVGWLIVILVALAAWSVFTFLVCRRVFRKVPLAGLSSMIGTRGVVVKALAPRGTVNIGGELWEARAEAGEIEECAEVMVVGQDGLKLVVRKHRF